MKFGTTVLGAALGGLVGASRGGKALHYALWGGGLGFVASLLGVNATGGIAVGADERRGRRAPGANRCFCWANVDVFGNIQDHQTCYPTHADAANKTNGFPGTPSDSQGGDHFTMVPCP